MPRRWTITLLAVLLVSLAANVFAAGFFLRPFHRHHGDHEARLARFAAMAAIGRESPDLEAKVREQVDGVRPAVHQAYLDMANARIEVRDAVRADPFDAARLDTALANLRARSSEFQAIVHGAVVTAVSEASPESRQSVPPSRLKQRMQDNGTLKQP
jgi:uncharacterized membrane protein